MDEREGDAGGDVDGGDCYMNGGADTVAQRERKVGNGDVVTCTRGGK